MPNKINYYFVGMPIRLFIDFASGDNFEMPSSLFEKYESYYAAHHHQTFIKSSIFSQWPQTLSVPEREEITLKKPK